MSQVKIPMQMTLGAIWVNHFWNFNDLREEKAFKTQRIVRSLVVGSVISGMLPNRPPGQQKKSLAASCRSLAEQSFRSEGISLLLFCFGSYHQTDSKLQVQKRLWLCIGDSQTMWWKKELFSKGSLSIQTTHRRDWEDFVYAPTRNSHHLLCCARRLCWRPKIWMLGVGMRLGKCIHGLRKVS